MLQCHNIQIRVSDKVGESRLKPKPPNRSAGPRAVSEHRNCFCHVEYVTSSLQYALLPMEKLERPPQDYIHRVMVQGALTLAVSLRGEVVLYRDSQRLAAVQIGEVLDAVLLGSTLLAISAAGVTALDTETLQVSSTNIVGGQHISAAAEYVATASGSTLNVYMREKHLKRLEMSGKIADVVLDSTNGVLRMVVAVVSQSCIVNKTYNFENSQVCYMCESSPGFGYPLITQTCLSIMENTLPRYIQASMEGKVSISGLNGDGSFVFRPHRITLTDSSLLAQPVFSLAICGNVLVTGGDGVLGIWDINTKKRTSQIRNLNGAVTAVAMDGRKIVAAVCDAGVKNSDLSQDLNLVDSQLFELMY